MNRGMYDGFEGYRSASRELRDEAVQSWLVVLDTNVLLNLYDFQGRALTEFTDVFRALGERLFVPHQVLDEFWRNRLRALRDNQANHRERLQIVEAMDAAEKAFRKWHQRVVDRLAAPSEDAIRELDEARSALLMFIDEHVARAEATNPGTPTQDDHVLRRLEPILEGRVGEPPVAKELERLVETGKQRIAAKRPPGYMDAQKSPDRAVGDYIVWAQTLEEATRRDSSVLLITNDLKEDWWADRQTAAARARPELVAEFAAVTGKQFLMMRSRELIESAGLLGVSVSESTLTEAAMSLESDADDSWTSELAVDYLDFLSGWDAHYRVFLKAVDNGGRIKRSVMAKLLGKDPQAGMRGSGKPFVTAVRRVVEYHELDVEPTLPLYADYEVGGWMTQFVMPPQLVSLFAQAISDHQASHDEGDATN